MLILTGIFFGTGLEPVSHTVLSSTFKLTGFNLTNLKLTGSQPVLNLPNLLWFRLDPGTQTDSKLNCRQLSSLQSQIKLILLKHYRIIYPVQFSVYSNSHSSFLRDTDYSLKPLEHTAADLCMQRKIKFCASAYIFRSGSKTDWKPVNSGTDSNDRFGTASRTST